MTQKEFIKAKLELFRQKYREAYKGILPDDILEQGNKWFDDELSSAIADYSKVLEKMVVPEEELLFTTPDETKEIEDGIRGYNQQLAWTKCRQIVIDKFIEYQDK